MIAKHKELKWQYVRNLSQLIDTLQLPLDKTIAVVAENLHDGPYTKEEVCKELEISEGDQLAIADPINKCPAKMMNWYPMWM